jgi:GNAT superfamily N-acetyltransferase
MIRKAETKDIKGIIGKHIGKALYEFVRGYAKSIGCYNITLNVWEGNEFLREREVPLGGCCPRRDCSRRCRLRSSTPHRDSALGA